FQAEDGIRDDLVTGVQTCALPIWQLPRVAELAQQIPEVVECHRITGEDCFILKVYIPAIDQLDRLLDSFLLYGSTTTSIIQSSRSEERRVGKECIYALACVYVKRK